MKRSRLSASLAALPVVLAVLLLSAGCCTSDSTTAQAPGEWWIRTELFFGMAKPDGSLVTADEWTDFLDTRILPQFPAGLTVVNADGRYRGENAKLYKEPSRVVILFYPRTDEQSADGRIAAIATHYCDQFNQESVLRVDSLERASFLARQSASP